MLLEASKPRKLVANLNHTIFIRFEEESNVAVVHYRTILELGSLLGGKSEVRIHPCLLSC
jgi:hypothetical protein